MITGDSNEATVEWIIQYRINSPADYLFRARKPEETLRDVSESVMREVVGDRTVDEVLTVGRKAIEDEATVKMQSLVTKYELGLRINQIQLKNVNPPEEVQSSFNAVNEAKQQREQLIQELEAVYLAAFDRLGGLEGAVGEVKAAQLAQMILNSKTAAIEPLQTEIEKPVLTTPGSNP